MVRSKDIQDSSVMEHSTLINDIEAWLAASQPFPSQQNTRTQIADATANFGTLIRILAAAGDTYPQRDQLGFLGDVTEFVQRQIRSGQIDIAIEDLNQIDLLCALCNQFIALVGIARTMEIDLDGAIAWTIQHSGKTPRNSLELLEFTQQGRAS